MQRDVPDFDRMAKVYERVAEPLTGQFSGPAIGMAKLAAGDRAIDVAAGTGGLAVRAAGFGARVLATDLSAAMVARAAERLQPFPGSAARVMDCAALDAPDGDFDLGFSMFGILLLDAWRDGLHELVRVVRPGGRVVVAAWTAEAGATPVVFLGDVFERVLHRPVWGGDLNDWSEARLHEAMRDAGCVDVAIGRHACEQHAPSVDAYLADMEEIFRLMPSYAALTEDEHARIGPPLRRALERYATAGGAIRVPSSAFVACGSKPG